MSEWSVRGIRAGAWIAVVLAGALPAGAAESGLKDRVEARLRRAGIDREADVTVAERGDAIVLQGAATTVAAQRKAEQLARKEAGTVVNELAVVPAAERARAEVSEDVRKAIFGYVHYTVFDAVGYELEDDGVVTLQGSVNQPYRSKDLEARVARIEGIRGIRNEIRVQPPSTFDDRLRAQLARAIYGGGDFAHYGTGVYRPVRIIVDRGRITLYGTVNSRVEQVMVGHIARSMPAFQVDNRIEVEGERSREGDGGKGRSVDPTLVI